MVNSQGLTIHKTNHKKGSRHDYDIYKKNRPVTPKQVVNVFDLGYLGVGKDFPDLQSSMPNRKKRKQDLSQEETGYNQNHSRERMVIEHTICRIVYSPIIKPHLIHSIFCFELPSLDSSNLEPIPKFDRIIASCPYC